MSDEEREAWERRYREGDYRSRTTPSPLLTEWAGRLPRGRALDVACGTGRNAMFLAARGFQVDAVDISTEALRQGQERAAELGLHVCWHHADLDELELPIGRYDVVVSCFYVNRALVRQLERALRAGGSLLYEQHLLTTEPGVAGPGSSAWRLEPNEALRLFSGLRVLSYQEALVGDVEGDGKDHRRIAVARLVACKGCELP